MRRWPYTALIATLVALTACSEAPQKTAEKKEPLPPPEPISGSSAFFQMYSAARAWAPDLEVVLLRSLHLPGVKYEPGKAAAWEVRFASQRLQRARSYTYSTIEAEGNLHKGVFAGLEETWTGPRGPSRPFNFQALKKDSTEAYAVAMKKGKGAAEYSKKNPDKKISFLLEATSRHPNAAWRVLWGDSVSTSNYSVYVDASTGDYLETMR